MMDGIIDKDGEEEIVDDVVAVIDGVTVPRDGVTEIEIDGEVVWLTDGEAVVEEDVGEAEVVIVGDTVIDGGELRVALAVIVGEMVEETVMVIIGVVDDVGEMDVLEEAVTVLDDDVLAVDVRLGDADGETVRVKDAGADDDSEGEEVLDGDVVDDCDGVVEDVGDGVGVREGEFSATHGTTSVFITVALTAFNISVAELPKYVVGR